MRNLYNQCVRCAAAMVVCLAGWGNAHAELTPADCINKLPITNTPEGVLHDNLFRSGSGMYCYGGVEQKNSWNGEIGKIVVNGDKIYVFNSLISGLTYTWMEGSLSEDSTKVTVHTPQLIMGSEAEGWREFLMNVKYDAATVSGVPDEENRDIIFSYVDGVLTLEEGLPGIFEWAIPTDPWTWEPIGDTEQWVWSGYADDTCKIEPFDYTMQQPPKDTLLEDYELYFLQGGVTIHRPVKLGISGNEVWVNGVEDNYPEAFIKGTVENGELTFDTQFICLDEIAKLFQFLLPARAEFDNGDDEASGYHIADKATLIYNESEGSFKAGRDEVLFVNGGTASIYALSIFEAPELRKKYDGELARPADPVILTYTPFDLSMGFGYFAFALPQVDENGNAIPLDSLYYVLYDGEEEIELDPDFFPNVPEYMVEIPYNFWCNDLVPNGPTRSLYFYYDIENPGVRLCYDRDNGAVISSDIIYAATSGLDSVNEENKILTEEYYNMNGMKVSSEYSGILVKKTTYSNGSQRVKKIFKR